MKIPYKVTKIVSFFLAILVIFTTIMQEYAFANPRDDAEAYFASLSQEVYNQIQATSEAYLDSVESEYKAGDWGQAHYRDHLPWNTFHNAVQAYINIKYDTVSIEETFHYGKEAVLENGHLAKGTYGRPDIIYEVGKEVLIWEVKPYSYAVSPNKEIGEDQLNRYVRYGIYNIKEGQQCRKGGLNTIQSDSFSLPIAIMEKNEIIYVVYYVKYTVQENSLILYQFVREEVERVPQTEIVNEPYAITLPCKVYPESFVLIPEYDDSYNMMDSKAESLCEIIEPSPAPNPDPTPDPTPTPSPDPNPIPGPEPIYEINVDFYFKLLEVATLWNASIDVLYRYPEARNTLFDTIHLICTNIQAQLPKVMALMKRCEPLAVGTSEFCGVIRFTSVDAQAVGFNLAAYNNSITEFEDGLVALRADDKGSQILQSIYDNDDEKYEELIKGIQDDSDEYDKAGEAQPPRDPLVIDLGETGIELCSLEHGVYFDLDNNGFAEKTAWIGTEDGFLALDRNGNGKIDNGGELFGDQVILEDGSKSSSGFEALLELDDNEDGIIDDEDSAFDSLMVWIDQNHNGISEWNELKRLLDMNIKSISLDHTEISFVDDETGTRIAETAEVKLYSGLLGTTTEISEFWFPVNSSDTTHGNTITAGNVSSIWQAMENDESGQLSALVNNFAESYDIAQKRYYLKQILYFITDADSIPEDSRGGNIDARDLKVIEEFMGREFIGVGGPNPNSNAAYILKGIYSDIENKYYSILNLESRLGGYLYGAFEYEDENGNPQLSLILIYNTINNKIANGEDVDAIIYDFCIYLQSYDEIHGTECFKEWSEYYASISSRYAEIVELSKAGNIYIGTENNDSYIGTNLNDFIFGEGGNDTLGGGAGIDLIYGGAGNDTLYGNDGNDHLYGNDGDDLFDGGAGNDILEDDGGNDTYVFTRGYGTDTIMDNGGTNTLRFTNLTEKDILVNGIDEYDVAIKIKGTNDTLIIRNFRENDDLADYMLEFKDQTMHCTDENSPFRHIYGSDSDDVLKAVVDGSIMHAFSGNDTVIGSDGKDVIYGNNGNDTIYAGEENDTIYGGNDDDVIYGEAGDDVIFGEDGQDTIDGGAGNDYIYSGNGDDILLFGRDYGRDIIEDSDGITTIQLADPLTASEITIYRIGNDAAIHINDTEDICIISGYGTSPDNYRIAFGDEIMDMRDVITEYDGSGLPDYTYIIGTADSDAIFAEQGSNLIASDGQYDYIVGGEDMDIIFGDDDTDRILAGAGNDILYGGIGGDQLYGEDGDDFLSGGAGNDYINGGTGDDSIVAGAGDDFIDGGAGDDIYFFNAGDGNDSILDSEGSNVVLFGDGITTSGLKAYRSNWNDLLITFEGLDDTLIIKNYCINDEARSFRLIFADGIVGAAADPDSVLRNINDTSGTEYMPTIYHDGITLTSSDGDDQLIGSEAADTLIGGNGNNRIIGNGGDDSLDGGAGKDYLNGGAGNDAYIYKKGYGTDTISDSEGVNTIEISGYAASEVRAYRTNWNDITLILDGSGESGLSDDSADKIVIEGFYTSDTNRNFYLSFNGSVIHATAGTSPLRTVYGTTGNDYMQGFDNQGISLHGGDGGDTLNGTDSKDYLYGGRGDDRMLASGGDDILNGESGNDYLEGGAGNDMYIIELGTGSDSINDNQGMNTISFGEGFNKDTLKAYRTNWNDLTITFEGVEDTVIIQGYFTSGDNRNFSVIFADGSRYEYNSLDNPIHQVYLTEGDDWTSAWSDDGVFMNSMSGNDTLTGGLGNDTFIGGTGNDTLTGGAGDDTYCFASGDGMDTIEDTEGVNRIILQDLLAEHVEYSYENVDGNIKFMITILETGEVITINNYDPEHFYIEYADGMAGNAVITEDGVVFVIPEEVEE